MNTEKYYENAFNEAIESDNIHFLGLDNEEAQYIMQSLENFRSKQKKTYTLRFHGKSINTIKRFTEKNGIKYQTYLSNFIDEIAEKMECIESIQKSPQKGIL